MPLDVKIHTREPCSHAASHPKKVFDLTMLSTTKSHLSKQHVRVNGTRKTATTRNQCDTHRRKTDDNAATMHSGLPWPSMHSMCFCVLTPASPQCFMPLHCTRQRLFNPTHPSLEAGFFQMLRPSRYRSRQRTGTTTVDNSSPRPLVMHIYVSNVIQMANMTKHGLESVSDPSSSSPSEPCCHFEVC